MSSTRETTISSLASTLLTRHLGRPTRQAVKHTRRELGIIYAAAKTSHADFPLGSRFGFAAAILTSKSFINAFNLVCERDDELADDWEFEIPERPSATDPSITDDTSDTYRRKKVAEWAEHTKQWERFDAYEHVFKNKLEGAFDSQYFDTLRDDLLGYTHVCVSEMLDHLLTQCLALTDVEKQERLAAVGTPWNQDLALGTYFHNLDRLQEELDGEEIEWTDRQKIMQAIKEMYACNLFEAHDMKTWEKKPAADKTWVHLRAYFGELYTDIQRYSKATGARHGFESAANIQEAPANERATDDEHLARQLGDIALAATADKNHIQQMSDATDDLLKIIKQQAAQITELVRQNGLLIAAVGQPNNEQTTTNTGTETALIGTDAAAEKAAQLAALKKIDGGDTALKEKRGRCVVCARHWKTAICFELACNKDKRPQGWRSRFT